MCPYDMPRKKKQGEQIDWLLTHVASGPRPQLMTAYQIAKRRVICVGRHAAFRHEFTPIVSASRCAAFMLHWTMQKS